MKYTVKQKRRKETFDLRVAICLIDYLTLSYYTQAASGLSC